MGWFDSTDGAGGSWLDNINELTTGLSKTVTTVADTASKLRMTSANTALQVNQAQTAAAKAAAAGPITAQTLFSGSGPAGDLARYVQTPHGRLVMLAAGAVLVYYIAKHVK